MARTGWQFHKGYSHKRYREICPDKKVRHKLLVAISHAILRCLNPSDASYKDYGGRGIKVQTEWVNDRAKFLAYLLTLPGHQNPKLFLDREDNNGHYEPGNLRFVTRVVSNQNQRRRRFQTWSTGVTFDSKRGKWVSQWTSKGKTSYFGAYRTKKEALAVSAQKRIEILAKS
jgi:hypothetical protein